MIRRLKIQFWNERIQGFLEHFAHSAESICTKTSQIVSLIQNYYKNRAFYFFSN